MYLYIGWRDSIGTHPNSRPYDFIVDLPKTLRLEDQWEVALTDIKVKSTKKVSFYVVVDFCEESILQGSQYQVLRRIDDKTIQYPVRYFVKIVKSKLQSIKISLLDQKLQFYEVSDFLCTLKLKKKT